MSLPVVPFESLLNRDKQALDSLREAFAGDESFGMIAVSNVPGLIQARRDMVIAVAKEITGTAEVRKDGAQVRSTWPGWKSRVYVADPLQGGFVQNPLEDLGPAQVDPWFGPNRFHSAEFKSKFGPLNQLFYKVTHEVVGACDVLLQEDDSYPKAGRKALGQILSECTGVYANAKVYDSDFSRTDDLTEKQDKQVEVDAELAPKCNNTAGYPNTANGSDDLASMRTNSGAICTTRPKQSDELSSMRTNSGAICTTRSKQSDELSSMRTNSGAICTTRSKQSDELSSMRTNAGSICTTRSKDSEVPSSMQTHTGATFSTRLKDSDDVFSTLTKRAKQSLEVPSLMTNARTISATMLKQSDELSSMRTNSGAVFTTRPRQPDELSSMRTNSGAICTTRSKQSDELSSMRTNSGAICTTRSKQSDELSSMRTNSGAICTTRPKQSDELSSMRTNSGAICTTRVESADVSTKTVQNDSNSGEFAPYWLPWHIDKNYFSTLSPELYFNDTTGELAENKPQGDDIGLLAMNAKGTVINISNKLSEDMIMVIVGAAAQVYTGGSLRACRHCVKRVGVEPNLARCVYNWFWYGSWNQVYDIPPGIAKSKAINSGKWGLMEGAKDGAIARRIFGDFRNIFQRMKVHRETGPEAESFTAVCDVLPHPAVKNNGSSIIIDMVSDVTCPLSYVAQKTLLHVIGELGVHVTVRYHPWFSQRPEEDMVSAWVEEHQVQVEQVVSSSAGKPCIIDFKTAANVFNDKIRCYCAVAAAGANGSALYEELCRRYLEHGQDISTFKVLVEAFKSVGMPEVSEAELPGLLFRHVPAVMQASEKMKTVYSEVPNFVVRQRVSSQGLELRGSVSADDFKQALLAVKDPKPILEVGANDLLIPEGCVFTGFAGMEVFVQQIDRFTSAALMSESLKDWAGLKAWPYQPSDFAREDETDDSTMYDKPKLVDHIDKVALARLTGAYRAILGTKSDGPLAILDTCSSWKSHLPGDMLEGARVAIAGMNEYELQQNQQATEFKVADLNKSPELPYESNSFDFVTNVASVAYLVHPREVFAEMHRVLKPGGVALISFSHHCFHNKAVNLWRRNLNDGAALCEIVRNYFTLGPQGGWQNICHGEFRALPEDPLWLVTAVKR